MVTAFAGIRLAKALADSGGARPLPRIRRRRHNDHASTHGPRVSVRLGRGLDRPPVFPVGAPNGRLRRPFMDTQQFGAEDWRRFLSSLGEDPQRSGLLE